MDARRSGSRTGRTGRISQRLVFKVLPVLFVCVSSTNIRRQSPTYSEKLFPDSDHFMAMPIKIMAGYDNLIFGEAVPHAGGNNGVSIP